MEKIIDEMIAKYKQDKLMSQGFIVDDLGTGTRAVYKEIDEVLVDLKQLKSSLPTQQDKVVAEWIEYAKKKGHTLFESARPFELYGVDYLRVGKWIKENEDIFARAWLDGYTVEKEQLYYVMLPEKNTDTYNVYGLKKYSDGKINVACYDKGDIGKSMNSKLTEREIKSVHENYWAFAVPVEEEAE